MTIHKTTLLDKKILEGMHREGWLSIVFDNMPQMAGVLDTDGRLLDVNRTALMKTKETKKDTIGKYFWDTSWWQFDAYYKEKLKQSIAGAREGSCCSFETVTIRSDGEKRHVHFTCEPLYDDEGQVKYLLALGTDITETRQLNEELEERNRNFQLLFEKSGDANLVLKDGKVLDCNGSALGIFKAEHRDQLVGVSLKELTPEYQLNGEPSVEHLRRAEERLKSETTLRYEWVHQDFQGESFFGDVILTKATIRGAEYIYVSIRDISDRKRFEDELRRISFYDRLTGLYNRHYFEEEIERLQNSREENIGVIVLDVNGLKITNDTMGHETGDVLLKALAECISSSVRNSDFVARIGGDEFTILLQESKETMIQKIIEKIRMRIEKYNQTQDALILSVAFGYAISRTGKDILSKLREADDMMYMQKADEKDELRSKLAKAWMTALVERGIHPRKRIDRLEHFMRGFSAYIGLEGSRVEHLAYFAKYHDIGLVAMDTSLIMKDRELSEEERCIVRRHTEAGYRLAAECDELKCISEWILKHHERWDGSGYPSHIRGECIPLECRILALVDAYESMTSDLPYRNAMKTADALAEIEKHKGSQFDPKLATLFIQYIEDAPNYVYGDIVD